MKRVSLIPALLLIFSAAASAEEHQASVDGPLKEMVKVSENGLEPSTVILKKLDASVFLVNTTSNALISVDIEFGKHKPHCASDNMKFDAATGILRSIKPIAPQDFALTCFPEAGSYPVKVQGVKPQPFVGTITVE